MEILSLNIQSYTKPFFWVREKKQSSAEVDLAIPFQDKIIPVEIKSGNEGTLKSLNQFVESTNHSYAVRMYAGEFKVNKNTRRKTLFTDEPALLSGYKNKRVPRIFPEQLQTLA